MFVVRLSAQVGIADTAEEYSYSHIPTTEYQQVRQQEKEVAPKKE